MKIFVFYWLQCYEDVPARTIIACGASAGEALALCDLLQDKSDKQKELLLKGETPGKIFDSSTPWMDV